MKLRRRAVLVPLAATLAGSGLARAWAQSRPVRIGYLVNSPLVEPPSAERAAFIDELGKLGYAIGRNLAIEYRSAENETEFLPQLADELLKLEVDLILATGDAAALAAKAASTRIPIVFAQSPDPVGHGLVRSLARPGANVTGLSAMAPDLAGKRMQLLHETLPSAKRVALIWGAESRVIKNDVAASTRAAAQLGLRIEPYALSQADQVNLQLERIAKSRPDALFVLADTRMTAYRDIVLDWTRRHNVASVAGWSDFVRAGGLLSYSPSYAAMFRRSAHYIHRILKGAKPAELPVEQPTRFEMVINLNTAKALGVTIPYAVRLRADEVIE
ncbi:MAG: ABC transporter substrate-binding protein [Burkholderiaceae bacterium]